MYQFTQTIDCTHTDAFKLASDVRNTPDWNPGVIEVKDVSGDEIGEGTQFVVKVPKFGNQRMMVSEFSADKVFTYSTVSPMFAGYHRWEFSALEDKTRVDHTADVSLKGLFRILTPLLPLLRRTQRKNVLSEAAAFKTHLEKRASQNLNS
jgi:hypothetical protein